MYLIGIEHWGTLWRCGMFSVGIWWRGIGGYDVGALFKHVRCLVGLVVFQQIFILWWVVNAISYIFPYAVSMHNIIHTHNNALWDWEYYVEYSSHSYSMWGIFHIILLVPQNTAMGLNNVMWLFFRWFEWSVYVATKFWWALGGGERRRASDNPYYNLRVC